MGKVKCKFDLNLCALICCNDGGGKRQKESFYTQLFPFEMQQADFQTFVNLE